MKTLLKVYNSEKLIRILQVLCSLLVIIFFIFALYYRQNAYRDEWPQQWQYYNDGNWTGQWKLGNTYVLNLKTSTLEIQSDSMGSPRVIYSIYWVTDSNHLEIYYNEFIEGVNSIGDDNLGTFKKHQHLFTIVREEKSYSTDWKNLKPIYSEANSMNFGFQPQ